MLWSLIIGSLCELARVSFGCESLGVRLCICDVVLKQRFPDTCYVFPHLIWISSFLLVFFMGVNFLKQEIMNININAKGHKIFLYCATLSVSQRGSLSLSDCFLSPQQTFLPHQYTQCLFLVKMASGSLTPMNPGQSPVHIKKCSVILMDLFIIRQLSCPISFLLLFHLCCWDKNATTKSN